MSQGKGDLGDPGGGTLDGYMSDTVNGDAHAFARSGKMGRSPTSSQKTGESNVVITSGAQEGQVGLGLGLLFTPKANSSNIKADQQNGQLGRTAEVRKKVEELYEFIKEKHNVHHKIRALVTSIKSGMLAVEREQLNLTARVEKAEKQLKEMAVHTPKGRTGKRDRDTPGDEEVSKKQKEDKDEADENMGEFSGWRTVLNKKEKKIEKNKNDERKKEEKKREEKKIEEKKKEQKKPLPWKEKIKGDALVVTVKEGASYEDLLRRVREDPQLKELGENVVGTRRTQKGDMLIELKKDPAVRSLPYKQLVEKSLGQETGVRALSNETVVECKNLDEITTADELQRALKVQCRLEESESMVIKMRKAYGGTQVASIRLSLAAANKLLEIGKVKVGWSVCSLRTTPRVTKQMERCYRCFGYGHQARNCAGPDRSKLCWKCGANGHFANDCARPAKCMLCKPQDGNDHVTGSFKCSEYKKAMANQQ